VACSPSEQDQVKQPAVAFEASDECHVCGMVIGRFPGPKGQAFETRSGQMKKFCSTMEMIYWYLQPENRPNVTDLYVHDMAKTPWGDPQDTHLISAKQAYYVIGSDLQGSMGPTLASFSTQKAANDFIKDHGGKPIDFKSLTLTLLSGR